MSTTYELQEKLKQLEKEIQELVEEQNRYLRILNKKRREELTKENSIEEELCRTPICISEFARKYLHSLSRNGKDTLSKQQLDKRIEEAVNYICSCR